MRGTDAIWLLLPDELMANRHMGANRLLLREVPAPHENIHGYLARLALLNHIRGPKQILTSALGSAPASVKYDDVPRLANFCRLHPEEMSHCSGLLIRDGRQPSRWQVCGQMISKGPFIVGTHTRICPACLSEHVHVRGLWSLSLYAACGIHGCSMVDTCIKCGRKVLWKRHSAEHCLCGHQHASSPLLPASDSSRVVAELMEMQVGQRTHLSVTAGMSDDILAHMSRLNLDELCRAIWFFGEYLPLLEGYGEPAHHSRLGQEGALSLIQEAVQVLSDWPARFTNRLESCRARTVLVGTGTYSLTEALLGPVDRFLREDLQAPEFEFIRAYYDQHIRGIWKALGKRHRRRFNAHQLELDWGE